jgi:hypothetical protein
MGRDEFKLRSRWLSQWCGMVTRIEPSTGSTFGAPDVHVANASVAGFVEFKVVEAGGTFSIRQNQRLWHAKYQRISPNSAFCIVCQQGFWMLPSKLALLHQRVYGPPMNWEALRPSILTFALKHVFAGGAFSYDTVEHLLEPLVMEGVGSGKGQKARETCRASR